MIEKGAKREQHPEPTLPSLHRVDYGVACVGGGFSAASFLMHLLDDCIAIARGGVNITGVPLHDMPCPPRIRVTVFEPSEVIGRGIAFRQCPEDEADFRLTNGPARKAVPICDDPEFEPWLRENHGTTPDRAAARWILGDYTEHRLGRYKDAASEAGVALEIDHKRCYVHDAAQAAGGSLDNPACAFNRYHLWDDAGTRHGPFDSIVVASGHNAKPVPKSESPLVVHDGSDFSSIKRLCAENPKLIVLGGFGSTAEETLLMLKSLDYKGGVLIASPVLNDPLDKLLKLRPFQPKTFAQKYMLKLLREHRIQCIQGKASHEILGNGGVMAKIIQEGKVRFRPPAAVVYCAPYQDRVDQAGRSHNRFIRSLQERKIIPYFNPESIYTVDEHNRAAHMVSTRGGEVYAAHAKDDVFMIGPPSINHPTAWGELFARDAPKVSWGVAMHAYYRAWQVAYGEAR